MKGVLLLSLLSCIAMPVAAVDDTVPVSGKVREGPVRKIVLHATGGPDCDASRSFRGGTLDGIVGHFLRNRSRISIHYVIGRDGRVVAMVPESRIAWHVRGHNRDSIGIELVNDGDGVDQYSDPQIGSLIELLRGLLDRHQLDVDAIKTHDELDNSTIVCDGVVIKRKQDPGRAFPREWVNAQLRADGKGS
jgi:N-acetyl-anhydromuramyl-L-alanine amidase AmpD